MKRCPKCNRTFPDENQKFCTVDGGLLIAAQPTFDPNATMRASASDLGIHTSAVARDNAATSRELPDLNATIAADSGGPTAMFPPRNTAATGRATSIDLPPPAVPAAAPPTMVSTPAPAVVAQPAAPPQKKSKLPLILGLLVVLLLLFAGGAAGAFFLVVKPWFEEQQRALRVPETPPVEEVNRNSNTENANASAAAATPEITKAPDTFVPPANAVKFVNSRANLDGRLAEHYLDFSFYYPRLWRVDPKAGVFVKVQKTSEDETGEYLLESASFNWYASNGSFDSDLPVFADRVKSLENQIAPGFPGYQKVNEGETKVNSLRAYEFRFRGIFKDTGKGDLPYWGRVIFVPPTGNENNGVVITLLATSLASEVSGVEEIGERGEMPVILESFRLGRN